MHPSGIGTFDLDAVLAATHSAWSPDRLKHDVRDHSRIGCIQDYPKGLQLRGFPDQVLLAVATTYKPIGIAKVMLHAFGGILPIHLFGSSFSTCLTYQSVPS